MPYYNNQYYNPYYANSIQRPMYLQGKVVDNIEMGRIIDIPLDGSCSYFPLADGSAIVSKQLKQDGTSKIVVYRPEEEKTDSIKYVTETDLEAIRNELEALKKQIKEGVQV